MWAARSLTNIDTGILNGLQCEPRVPQDTVWNHLLPATS